MDIFWNHTMIILNIKNNKKNNLSQFKEDHAIIGVQNTSKVLIVTLVGPGDFRIISHNKCSCNLCSMNDDDTVQGV